MKPRNLANNIAQQFKGVVEKASWGETSLFYNPGQALPNGVYFCTIKEKNGDNDKASKLDREGIFRLSIGISPSSYETLFGPTPKRPAKGCTINTDHDFTTLNTLMPHPIYGWMSWVQILNPKQSTLAEIEPLLAEAYQNAMIKYEKKVAKND